MSLKQYRMGMLIRIIVKWEPILVNVFDRAPAVYQNLNSQVAPEGTLVIFI